MYQLAEFISKLCTTRKINSKINTCVLILIGHNFRSWWNGIKVMLILGLCQCLSAFVIILCSFQNITQNYLVVIFSNFLRFSCLYCSCLAQLLDIFSPEISRQAQFWKKYYCRNYSDDVCQCLNTEQILLRIQYFDHNTL